MESIVLIIKVIILETLMNFLIFLRWIVHYTNPFIKITETERFLCEIMEKWKGGMENIYDEI